MPQSLAKILVHLIFSTKNRFPFLTEEPIRSELNSYLAGVLREWDSPAIPAGSVKDHVHILCALSKNHAMCKIVEEIKRSSSKWIKTKDPQFEKFQWQNGYGAFSVSQSDAESVRAYILHQDEHHRTRTFQEEFRLFLERYQVPYDERYVWD